MLRQVKREARRSAEKSHISFESCVDDHDKLHHGNSTRSSYAS